MLWLTSVVSLTKGVVSGWSFRWGLAAEPFKLPLHTGLVGTFLLGQTQHPVLLCATLDCRSLTLTKFPRNDTGKIRLVERLH